MPTATPTFANLRLRPRGLAALLLMVTYLFAGVLHGLYDIDVTTPYGNFAVARSVDKPAGQSDKGGVAEHHCHGCFSVLVPAPVQVSVAIEPKPVLLPQLETRDSGLIPGIDTPPPKNLT